MTLAYLGSLSVGASVPGASVAVDAGMSGINGALPNLAAQLAALLAFAPTPVDFDVQLQLAKDIVLSVSSGIALGLPVPDADAQIAIITAQIAIVTAQIAAVNAQLGILIALSAPLLAAGVHGYAFDGAVGALGGELSSALAGGVSGGGGGGEHANAVVFITTVPATWDAMGDIFKVTP